MAAEQVMIRLRTQGARTAQAELHGVGRAAGDLDGKGRRGGRGLRIAAAGAAALVAAGVGAAKALHNLGAAFDDSYDTIRIGTGATGRALDLLRDDFRAVVASVPTDFASAGTAIADLNTRLGLTGKPLQGLAGQFLELSRMTGTDLAGNIASITRAFNDWEIATGSQGDALDTFWRASQASGATIDQLTGLSQRWGAALRGAGFSLEESAALFATFERSGVEVPKMMPAITRALARFTRDGKDAGSEFQRVIADIADGTIDAAAAMDIFGDRAGLDMVEAVTQGRFALQDMLDAIADGDTIAKAARDTHDFAERWRLFKNQVLLKLEPIATTVFDAMGDGLDWISRNSDIAIPLLAGAAAGMTALGVAAGIATARVLGLNLAILANPFVLAAMGLAALVAGLVVAYKRVGWFRDAVDFAWGALKDAAGWIGRAWPKVTAVFEASASAIVNAFTWMRDTVVAVIEWIKGAIDDVTGKMGPLIKAAEKASDIAGGGGNLLGALAGGPAGLGAALGRGIVGRARGGTVLPGEITLVGERGPELLKLPAGTGVTPADRTRQILRGATQNIRHINITSPISLDGRVISSSVLRHVDDGEQWGR